MRLVSRGLHDRSRSSLQRWARPLSVRMKGQRNQARAGKRHGRARVGQAALRGPIEHDRARQPPAIVQPVNHRGMDDAAVESTTSGRRNDVGRNWPKVLGCTCWVARIHLTGAALRSAKDRRTVRRHRRGRRRNDQSLHQLELMPRITIISEKSLPRRHRVTKKRPRSVSRVSNLLWLRGIAPLKLPGILSELPGYVQDHRWSRPPVSRPTPEAFERPKRRCRIDHGHQCGTGN